MRTFLPCKENKCILYPICMSKDYIDCAELYIHGNYLESKGDYKSAWSILRESFPNLRTLTMREEDRDHDTM